MKAEPLGFLPAARRDGIISKELEDELLVYDTERDKAHCLNDLAGKIWRHCDGRATAGEIAAALSHEQGSRVDEKVVWLGLEELRRAHLLAEPTGKPCLAFAGMSRREVVRRIGFGAAFAVPVIVSMTAPTAVQAAASCKPKDGFCNTGAECCSGTCNVPQHKCVGN